MSTSRKYMSEQKTSHKVKGTGIGQKEAETREMIVWRHVLYLGKTTKHSAALKVLKSILVSMTLKCMTFLNNQGCVSQKHCKALIGTIVSMMYSLYIVMLTMLLLNTTQNSS